MVQLGLYAGGLVRTWDSASESALWAVDDPGWLLANQAVGRLARTVQEEGRFREEAFLSASTGTLMV